MANKIMEATAILPVKRRWQVRSHTCGYVSAWMVLEYFNIDPPRGQLSERIRITSEGTRQVDLVHGLRSYGLGVGVRYDLDYEQIKAAITNSKPLIVYDHKKDHWLVVHGFGLAENYTKKYVYTADPNRGAETMRLWEKLSPKLKGFGLVCSNKTFIKGGL